MTTIILVIHVILAIAMVITVLLQRSDGGALGSLGGGGSGGGGLGGIMSGRQSASFLTRATGVLAAAFMATSLILAILASRQSEPTSILDLNIESDLAPLSTGTGETSSGDPEGGSADPVSDGPRVPVSE